MDDYWWGDSEDAFKQQAWRAETITKLSIMIWVSEIEGNDITVRTCAVEGKNGLDDGKTMGGSNKKMKMDESEFRLQCRISCGADAVIKNELPYLLPSDFIRSYVYVDEDKEDDDEDSIDTHDYVNDELIWRRYLWGGGGHNDGVNFDDKLDIIILLWPNNFKRCLNRSIW